MFYRGVRCGMEKAARDLFLWYRGIVMLADEVDVLCIKVLCQWKKLHQKGDPD